MHTEEENDGNGDNNLYDVKAKLDPLFPAKRSSSEANL
jgi:hypothetical protein